VAHYKRNKSVFSFLRQPSTWHCPHVLLHALLLLGARRPQHGRRRPLSINISCRGGGHTASNSPHTVAVVDRWDRQTNRRMDSVSLHRPCSAYYVSSANKQLWPQPFHSTMLVEITRPRPFVTARAQHHVMTVTHTTSTLTECNLSTATAPSVF